MSIIKDGLKPIEVELKLVGKGAISAVKKARDEINLLLEEWGIDYLKVGFARLPKHKGTGATLILKLSKDVLSRLKGSGVLTDLLSIFDAPVAHFGKKFRRCSISGLPLTHRPV